MPFQSKPPRRLINTQSKEEHEKLYGLIAAKSAQFAEDARRKVAKAHGRSFYVSISLCVAALAMAFVWAYVLMHTLTDRKEAEESLRSSETQKKAILDASIDRIMLVDPSDRIIWANKTAAIELGMAPEALTGRLCYELFAGRNQFLRWLSEPGRQGVAFDRTRGGASAAGQGQPAGSLLGLLHRAGKG